MIDDTSIEKALDWLRDNADEIGRAAANRYQLEEGRKRIKAVLMQKHAKDNPKLSAAAQERDAYADPEYAEYLKGVAEAIETHERLRALRSAAEARIEAWRSQQANARSMKI